MGLEIKNICTIAPNYYHPQYEAGYYHFSVFITPRLQFDGTLKEFYEMLHWPSYTGIFDKTDKGVLEYIKCMRRSGSAPLAVYKDNYYIDRLNIKKIKLDINKMRGVIWEKLFRQDTPVIAWPVTVSSQELQKTGLKGEANAKNNLLVTKVEVEQKLRIPEVLKEFKEITGSELTTNRMAFVSAAIVAMVNDPGATKMAQFTISPTERFVADKAAEITREKIKSKFENQKINQEFHKKISTLARYPHLLRMLGFIYDFKIKASGTNLDKDAICLAFDKEKIYKITGSDVNIDFQEFTDSVEFICPYTSVSITNERMKAFSNTEYEKLAQNGFVLKDLITINQEYIENMTQRMTDTDQNTAGFNTKTFNPDDLKIIKQKSQNLLSKGFSIKIKSQPQDLLTTMDKELNTLTDETLQKLTFEAHHLDCGYRIDVKYEEDKGWRSLCRRRADYNIDRSADKGKTALEMFLEKYDDEPWIEEVRQVDNTGDPKRIEEVARWNNWSITCPPLHSQNVAYNEDPHNNEYNDLHLSRITPRNLPLLRFNKKYMFRIRLADICGNGPSVEQLNNESTAKNFIVGGDNDALVYNRLEPIQAPSLFPNTIISYEKNDKITIDPAHMGESPDTLVIRTAIDEQGVKKNLQETCLRYVMPPHVNTNLAEVSGLFDEKWFKAKDSLYDFLKKPLSDHYSAADAMAPRLPYVFDPSLKGYTLYSADPGKSLDKNQVKIGATDFLTGSGGDKLDNTKAATIQIQRTIGDETKGLFQLDQGEYRSIWITGVNEKGEVSNSKKINLVHAVQRPVLLKGEDDNIVVNKALDKILTANKIQLNMESPETAKYHVTFNAGRNAASTIGEHFPATTVGEYILIAEYNELVLDSSNKNGWRYLPEPSMIRKSFNNFNQDTPEDAIDTILNDSDQMNKISRLENFVHGFPDTKAHEVAYKLIAVSKFTSFFNADELEATDAFQRSFDLGRQLVINSDKPEKPNITSLTPLFKTTPGDIRPFAKSGAYNFQHDGFRIYLGKTWYTSGFGEKIAVIFQKDNPTDISDKDPRLNKINVIGHDPKSADSATQSKFIKSEKSFILNDVSFEADTLDLRLFPRTASDKAALTAPRPEGNPYNYSIFEVHWDMKRGEFYADILLSSIENISYSALIKFAVCRYQPNSLVSKGNYDYRFSDIVMTQMVPLLPSRTVTLTGDKVTVDIHSKEGRRFDGEKYRTNQFYIVGEKDEVNDCVTITKIGSKETIVQTVYNYTATLPKIKDYDRITLEEYEDIRLDEQEKDHLYLTPENPRNDPGKRLVFFCPIK